MNKWRLALIGLMAFTGPLLADLNDESFGANDITAFDANPDAPLEEQGPFVIRAAYDYIGKAEFDKHPYKNQKFRFSEVDVDASAVFYYNPCYKEGWVATLGWTQDDLDWNQNPFFHQKKFQQVSLGLAAFTSRAENWDWRAVAKANIDPEHLNFQEYLTWDFLVWGRYKLNCDWGVHFGLLALTGMKIDRVYPIIGFDWTISRKWTLNAVFPTNISLLYKYSCNWTFNLAARFWEVRHRTSENQPLPRAVWIYRNAGIELGTTYKWKGWLANIHAGYAVGGKLKIANKHYRHKHNLNFNGSPYAGGEISYNF